MSGYTYESFERGLWTVGHRDESCKWHAESDHDDPQAAADRVHYLNGGTAPAGQQTAPGVAERHAAEAGLPPEAAAMLAKAVPALAAYEADIESLTDQRNRVSATADRLRAQVRNLRDALERCRDAAGRSPAAVHTIASQALAGIADADL